MKHLKQKLMAATAMLMVSAVMMTTSTYAWFAISTAPEVTTITTTVSATESFEIALGTDGATAPSESALGDSGDDTTWGATVTGINGFTAIATPSAWSSTNSALQVASYSSEDADGRLEKDLTSASTTIDYTLSSASDTDTIDGIGTLSTAGTSDTTIVASVVQLYIRTNTATTNTYVTASGVTITPTSETTKVTSTGQVGVVLKITNTDTAAVTYKQIAGAGSTSGSVLEGTQYDIGALSADITYKVEVIVYLDGNAVTNADMDVAQTINIEKIEFTKTLSTSS